MDITRIGLPSTAIDVAARPPARSYCKVSPATASPVLPVNAEGTAARDSQQLSIVGNVNYIKEQLDNILVNFPPFFPPGSPQRMDLIKHVNEVREKIKQSAMTSEAKSSLSDQPLPENASDKDISNALDGIFRLLAQNNAASGAANQSGTVVDLRI
jgi:hypothetical protein